MREFAYALVRCDGRWMHFVEQGRRNSARKMAEEWAKRNRQDARCGLTWFHTGVPLGMVSKRSHRRAAQLRATANTPLR